VSGIVGFIIAVIAAFVVVSWYALRRSQQRNSEFLDEMNTRMEPLEDSTDTFNAVLEHEMDLQIIDSQIPDIESEPIVNISEQAKQTVTTEPVAIPEQSKIDLTVDDDLEQQHSVINNVKDWDMVIAFTIMAPEGQKLSGLDLKAALKTLSFQHGDMQIYHRVTPGMHKKPLFSVANIIEPGTFNPEDNATMNTPGVLMFAKLPGPVNGLTLFDDLLETAQSLAEKLNGTLCDQSKQQVNQNILESMRSRILNMNLTIQAEQSQYDDGYSS
jgi:cell division protein ZipA